MEETILTLNLTRKLMRCGTEPSHNLRSQCKIDHVCLQNEDRLPLELNEVTLHCADQCRKHRCVIAISCLTYRKNDT